MPGFLDRVNKDKTKQVEEVKENLALSEAEKKAKLEVDKAKALAEQKLKDELIAQKKIAEEAKKKLAEEQTFKEELKKDHAKKAENDKKAEEEKKAKAEEKRKKDAELLKKKEEELKTFAKIDDVQNLRSEFETLTAGILSIKQGNTSLTETILKIKLQLDGYERSIDDRLKKNLDLINNLKDEIDLLKKKAPVSPHDLFVKLIQRENVSLTIDYKTFAKMLWAGVYSEEEVAFIRGYLKNRKLLELYYALYQKGGLK